MVPARQPRHLGMWLWQIQDLILGEKLSTNVLLGRIRTMRCCRCRCCWCSCCFISHVIRCPEKNGWQSKEGVKGLALNGTNPIPPCFGMLSADPTNLLIAWERNTVNQHRSTKRMWCDRCIANLFWRYRCSLRMSQTTPWLDFRAAKGCTDFGVTRVSETHYMLWTQSGQRNVMAVAVVGKFHLL